jgi:hypothetical protein
METYEDKNEVSQKNGYDNPTPFFYFLSVNIIISTLLLVSPVSSLELPLHTNY